MVRNFIDTLSANYLDKAIEEGKIYGKAKHFVLSSLEKNRRQLIELSKIDDSTFRHELMINRLHHYMESADILKYWAEPVHKQWYKSVIRAIFREEQRKIQDGKN